MIYLNQRSSSPISLVGALSNPIHHDSSGDFDSRKDERRVYNVVDDVASRYSLSLLP